MNSRANATGFLKWLTVIALLGLCALTASAQRGSDMVGRRQHREERRIRQGMESGRLTRREARRLQWSRRRLGQSIRRSRMSGGRLSRAERMRIQRRENHLSRRIYRLKHNDSGRWNR